LDQQLAQSQITADHDEGDLKDARYNVEKTRLGTAANEFVGRIQAEQARIDLGVAEQRLNVQDANIALHAASDKSRLASLTRQRDQAKADVELTKARIAQMEIPAPLGGVVVFVSNYNQGPLNAKPFKVGDNVYSGMNLAEIPDMSSPVMDAKVEEIDRVAWRWKRCTGSRGTLPELLIRAKITQISPLAELSNDYPHAQLRGYAALQTPDRAAAPGMNGGMDIVIDRIPKAISIPTKAGLHAGWKPVCLWRTAGPIDLRRPIVSAKSG
jgi:hypothetical protein